jgi:exopolysaccharide biosynthesis polyprenyl glycosylphosphotransferase
MSASATQVNLFTGFQAQGVRERSYRAPNHPPDVLYRAYTLLRTTPPLIAIGSFWMQAQWRTSQPLHALASATFSIRHVFLVVMLTIMWGSFVRRGKKADRNMPRLQFLSSQLWLVSIATAACATLLWAGKRMLGPVGLQLASLPVFALRCGAAGIAVVLFTAILYSIAYRISLPQLYLIVGSRQRAISAYKKLRAQNSCRAKVLGFLDPDDSHAKYLPGDYLGTLDRLESILVQNPVDMVYFALPLKSHYRTVQDAISICEHIGVDYSVQPNIFETRLKTLGNLPMRESRGFVYHVVHEDYRILLKRAIDISLAASLLLLLSPLMLVISLAVKLTSAGPVFFVQERYGRNRRRFRIYKYRSMVVDAEILMKDVENLNEAAGPIFKIRKDPRITRIGRILRRSSLDELPQLFNVLKGDMSLVGPRPMSLRDVHRFSEASLMRRFSAVPGLTGLWQVSGRSNTDFDTWMKLDLEYIDHWSLGLDLRILLRTVPAVLSGSGAA